jgi:putative ABC transport system permease protein
VIVSLRMPLRFLRGHAGRLALTVVALACGVGMVCAIDLVNRAVVRAFVDVVDAMAGRAALSVQAGAGGLFPEEVAATVAAVPGVARAVPVVQATAFTTDASGAALAVHGVDVGNEDAVRVYDARAGGGLELEDPLLFLSQADSVVVTQAFAERRALGVGDPLELMTPTGRRRFVVRGLLEAQGLARIHGGNLVVMDLYAAMEWFTRRGLVNRVDVVLDAGADVERVAGALRSALPPGLEVDSPAQRRADLGRVMRSLHALLDAVALVGLVAAFLIVFGRLSTVFEARAWQLGVLRAIGLRPRVVWWELQKETLLLGMIGVALGLPLGIGVARLLLPAVVTTTALNFKLLAPPAELAVRPASLLLAAGLGLVAAGLAGALPAWRATRMGVAAILRHRAVELAPAGAGRGWALRAVALAGILAAVGLETATRSATWGLVASFLIAVGAALVARPLLRGLAPLLARVAGVAGPLGRFAVAVVERNPRRTSLAVAMLGVGVGAVLWFWTMARSFERTIGEALAAAFQVDLAITSTHVQAGFVEAPLDPGLLGALRQVPGVRAVIGDRIADWRYGGEAIAVNAYDAAYFRDGRFGRWPLAAGRPDAVWPRVARGEAVTVSGSFAYNFDVRPGDVLTLETPRGPLRRPVAGVVNEFVSARGSVQMSRELYREHWGDEQVNLILVATDPGREPLSVRAAITAAVGRDYDLRILVPRDLVAHYVGEVRRAFAGVDVLRLLVLVVVLVGMADMLAASVAERTREIGFLRALGVRPGAVRRIVLLEALLVGGIGLGVAGLAGGCLGVLWIRTTFPDLLGWVLALHPPWRQVGTVAAMALGACLLAAVVPARRAAALAPAVALREE